MELLFILLLGFLIYIIVRNFQLIRTIYSAIRKQQAFAKKFRQAQQEREREASQPSSQSSVERINDASMDLDGGEYVEYEDVK